MDGKHLLKQITLYVTVLTTYIHIVSYKKTIRTLVHFLAKYQYIFKIPLLAHSSEKLQ